MHNKANYDDEDSEEENGEVPEPEKPKPADALPEFDQPQDAPIQAADIERQASNAAQ